MKFISFSGGVESRTMAILYGGSADAIFADTGFEHAALYAELDKVEAAIRAFHGNDFKIHRIRAENVEGTGADTLQDYILLRSFYPGFAARFCTRLFKITPIDNFLKGFDSPEIMIGLNADEAENRTGNHGLLANVTYSYPLMDAGISRAGCYRILKAAGISPQFPPYMRRGGCRGCYYKSKKEYAAMAILSPAEFDEVAAIEQKIQDERGRFFHVIPDIPNLIEFGRQARSVLFDANEIYLPVVNVDSNCGVFCNR